MSVDPIFWEIMGMPENGSQPLSFRAHGAFVLRPPGIDAAVAEGEETPSVLAQQVLAWSNDRLSDAVERTSLQTMIDDADRSGRGAPRALSICLRILNDDLEGAMELCRSCMQGDQFTRDSGGFSTFLPGGGTAGFVELAADWIARRRRAQLVSVS